MIRSVRSPSSLALTAAVGLLLLLGACGVDASTDTSTAPGVDAPATTLPDCPDGGPGTGGAVGSADPSPDCKPPSSPDPDPDPGPTTTEPDPGPTTTTSNGADQQEYVDAMITSLAKSTDADLAISDAQAECIGPEWVDIIGVQEMSDAGIAPDDLLDGDITEELKDVIDRSMAEDLVSVMSDCDFDVDQVIIDGITKGASLTPEQADCFVGRLPDGFGTQLLIVGLDGGTAGLDADPDLAKALRDAAAACP